MGFYVAIDMGASNCRLVAYPNQRGTVPLGERRFDMSTKHNVRGDYFHDATRVLDNIRMLERVYGELDGIGLAMAGKLDFGRERLTMAGNICHMVDKPIAQLLRDTFRCRVVLGNDAEASALADAVYGLGARGEFNGVDFIGMIWGSGIGGACVRYEPDGQLRTVPGEPGHLTVGPDTGLDCGCGASNCWECWCGGNRIRERLGHPSTELDDEEWEEVLHYMEIGLKSYLRVQPVPLVVFSGGVACGNLDKLDELESRLDSASFGSPKLRLSHFGESAGSLGALSLLSL